MKPIPKSAVVAAEKFVKELLTQAVEKYGKKTIPVADPDYAEAFGFLRGIICSRQFKADPYQRFRLAEGSGDSDHESVPQWLNEIIGRM